MRPVANSWYPERRDCPRHGPGPYAVIDDRVCTEGLEVIVTHHCNLRCRSCAYLAPTLPTKTVDPKQLHQTLATLARSFHATEARVLGGEPLLHPDLASILIATRRSGVCDTIRIITNGLLLPGMEPAFWEAVDEVSVSTYPGRELRSEAKAAVEAAAESHGVRLIFKPFTYFRESYSEIGTDDVDLVRRIFRTCQMAHVWRCITVWNGRLYRCPQSLFLPASLHGLAGATEGLEVLDSPQFLSELLTFLESDEPLAACRFCLGSVGELFQNQQLRRTAWREPQQVSSEALLDWPHLVDLETNPGRLVRDTSYFVTES